LKKLWDFPAVPTWQNVLGRVALMTILFFALAAAAGRFRDWIGLLGSFLGFVVLTVILVAAELYERKESQAAEDSEDGPRPADSTEDGAQ